jgi:hypothetical protein
MSIRSMNMPELNPAQTEELAEQGGEAEAVSAGGGR